MAAKADSTQTTTLAVEEAIEVRLLVDWLRQRDIWFQFAHVAGPGARVRVRNNLAVLYQYEITVKTADLPAIPAHLYTGEVQ